jgi:UDP-N-acetyl-D-mannosaminuronic acid dehydrogenase
VTHTHDVGVVGLGYVGLTLATALADVGLRVVGIEKRQDVVDAVTAGRPSFQEVGLDRVLSAVVESGRLEAFTEFQPEQSCATYIITVGTPLDGNGRARLDMIESATRQVADSMPDGSLVILRSTVKIGTTRNIVAPILQASGKKFEIAMCPERTLEGNALAELRQLPQIVGADTAETRDRAGRLFSHLTNQVLGVSSLETAEIVKLADNTYRDVWFGFANEVARLCDAVGVSANEVISTGKLGYPRTNIAQPGLVGGPCLEKDPHILRQSARDYGLSWRSRPRLGPSTNDSRPSASRLCGMS